MKSRFRFKLLAIVTASALALSAAAFDESFPTLQVGGVTYRNVTVTAVTATDIYFSYDGGMGNAKLRNLSPDLQQHFHYDPEKAAALEAQQARANANYLASQPPQWGTDLPAALNQARSQNRRVLMDFTGSDWCPCCMQLDHDVFSTPQFAGCANSRLILVRVDFPRNIAQSAGLKQANADLASRFNIKGYPTSILLDSSGKELWRMLGFPNGGPAAYISTIEHFSPMPVATTPPVTDTDSATATAGSTVTSPATPGANANVARIAQVIRSALQNWAPKLKLGQNWIWISSISSGLMILLTARAISKRSV